MRGKVDNSKINVPPLRITPAYAGKSRRLSLLHEKIQGSPPPMRGKVYAVFAVLSPAGITPAYAGKSHKQPNTWLKL